MPPQNPPSRLRRKTGKASKKRQPPKLSRLHKPAEMTLEEWQIQLRRDFGREQKFKLANLGDHPVFSDFRVTNPQSRNSYKVHIRGRGVGENACSCPDFATNTLGTCKHIEFTLSRLERKRDLRAQLKAGYQPPFSEIYLQYGSRREVRFRPGSDCPVELARLASEHFDVTGALKPESVAAVRARSWPRPPSSNRTCVPRRRAGLPGRAARRRAAAAFSWPRPFRAAAAARPSRTC